MHAIEDAVVAHTVINSCFDFGEQTSRVDNGTIPSKLTREQQSERLGNSRVDYIKNTTL